MPQANTYSSKKHANIPIPRVLPRSTRRKIEDAIEKHMAARDALIEFLDHCDGDTDFEPALGAIEPKDWSGDIHRYSARTDLPALDLEESCEGEAEQCEDEGAQCEDEGAHEHILGGGNA